MPDEGSWICPPTAIGSMQAKGASRQYERRFSRERARFRKTSPLAPDIEIRRRLEQPPRYVELFEQRIESARLARLFAGSR